MQENIKLIKAKKNTNTNINMGTEHSHLPENTPQFSEKVVEIN